MLKKISENEEECKFKTINPKEQNKVTENNKHLQTAKFIASEQIRSRSDKEKISDALLKLQTDSRVQVLFSGCIYRYVAENANFKLLNKLCIFCVNELPNNEFTFTIYDLNHKQLYEGFFDEQLECQTSNQQNYFKWLHKKDQIKVYLFQFDPMDASITIKVQIESNMIKRQLKSNILQDDEQEECIQQQQEDKNTQVNQITKEEEQKLSEQDYDDALRAKLESQKTNNNSETETKTDDNSYITQSEIIPAETSNNEEDSTKIPKQQQQEEVVFSTDTGMIK